jgi:NADH-quinone oxidoreductase subunit L
MLVPLVILAVLSICGGWVGSARFEKFLSPVFQVGMTAATANDAGSAVTNSTKREEQGPSKGLLTSISLGAAALGLYLAFLLYYRHPQLPQQIALALGGFYHTVVHKYYVDEIYAALFVKPLLDGSRRILWQGIDQNLIDAGVDNGAEGAREVSDSLRHMQSGNIRSYAGWVAAGAAVVIGYMVWMGTR